MPQVGELSDLTPEQSILLCQFGDLALIENEWPVIGRFPEWDREDWPMPQFADGMGPGGKIRIVTYSDAEPGKKVHVEFVEPEVAVGFPDGGLYGAGAVEIELTKLLANG